MRKHRTSRRDFLTTAAMAAGIGLASSGTSLNLAAMPAPRRASQTSPQPGVAKADYILRIAASPIEIAPRNIVSVVTYNGQFPGPLLRFKEGQEVTIEIHNDTDTPEQLHWHGQFVPTDVDGAAEEGTPFIPRPACAASCSLRNRRDSVSITRTIAGERICTPGQYSGQVGPVYIEPKHEPGNYDREVFLVLKEFEPSFSHGGDMAMDFLAPATPVKELEGRRVCHESVAGKRHAPRISKWATLFHHQRAHVGPWRAMRVKQGERVLFHVLNGSATEIRSLALPGHSFKVVALDGNPVPNRRECRCYGSEPRNAFQRSWK